MVDLVLPNHQGEKVKTLSSSAAKTTSTRMKKVPNASRPRTPNCAHAHLDVGPFRLEAIAISNKKLLWTPGIATRFLLLLGWRPLLQWAHAVASLPASSSRLFDLSTSRMTFHHCEGTLDPKRHQTNSLLGVCCFLYGLPSSLRLAHMPMAKQKLTQTKNTRPRCLLKGISIFV